MLRLALQQANQEIIDVAGRDLPKNANNMFEIFYRPILMAQGMYDRADGVVAARARHQRRP